MGTIHTSAEGVLGVLSNGVVVALTMTFMLVKARSFQDKGLLAFGEDKA